MSFKHTLDISAIGIAFGSLIGYLPAIASLLSIIWMSVQIYVFIKERKK